MTIWSFLTSFLLLGNVFGDTISGCNNISFLQSNSTRHYSIATIVTSRLRKAAAAEVLFNMDLMLNDKKKAKEDCLPPILLLYLDGARSLNTFHDKPCELDKASDVTKKKPMITFDMDLSSYSSSNKSEKDDSSASSSLDFGLNNEGSTPLLSSGPPAELLFDLDGTRLLKTIHDKPRELDKASEATKKKSMVAFDAESSSDSSSNKSETDDSSASSCLDLGVNNEGSTPLLSSVRSDPTALKVMYTTITLDNAQDSTMSG